jgi:hypothetical protein
MSGECLLLSHLRAVLLLRHLRSRILLLHLLGSLVERVGEAPPLAVGRRKRCRGSVGLCTQRCLAGGGRAGRGCAPGVASPTAPRATVPCPDRRIRRECKAERRRGHGGQEEMCFAAACWRRCDWKESQNTVHARQMPFCLPKMHLVVGLSLT